MEPICDLKVFSAFLSDHSAGKFIFWMKTFLPTSIDMSYIGTVESNPGSVRPDDEIKSSPIYSKSCPKSRRISFKYNSDIFQNSQIVATDLGYFCKKISQDLSKIAQFGHTAQSQCLSQTNFSIAKLCYAEIKLSGCL